MVRYVERNALRANLVQLAEDWRWSSLWRRQHPDAQPIHPLATWPLPLPPDWLAIVNRPQTEAEREAVRRCVNRDAPRAQSPRSNGLPRISFHCFFCASLRRASIMAS
jgi:putative transposase